MYIDSVQPFCCILSAILALLWNCSSILLGQLFDSEIEDMKCMFEEEEEYLTNLDMVNVEFSYIKE